MNKRLKATIALLVIVSIIMPFIPFKALAFDAEDRENYAQIELGGNVIGVDSENRQIECGDGDLHQATITVEDVDAVVEEDDGRYFLYTKEESVGFSFVIEEGYIAYTRENGASQPTLVEENHYTMENLVIGSTNNRIDFEFEEENSQPGNNPGEESYIDVQFDAVMMDEDEGTVTFDVEDIDVTVTVNGTNIEEGHIHVDRNNLSGVTFTISDNFDSDTMSVVIRGADNYAGFLTVSEENEEYVTSLATVESGIPDGGLHFAIENKENGGNNNNDEYEDITLNVTFNDTMGEVILNNNFHTQEGVSFSETLPNAGYTDNSKTNKIHVVTSYGENVASKVNINGEEYDYDANGYDVAGSSTYTIVVTGDPSVVTPKTVIWANPDYVPEDEADAEWVADFTINHGYARAIAVYDDQDQLLDPSEYTNGESDEFGLRDGLGWVGIYPGSRVIFEFEPEYGYQLTDIKINDEQIDNPTETPNQYEFTMIDGSGNIHFSANFEPIENTQVIGTGTSISDMNYTLEEGTLDSGTAVLSIDKVTDLSNEQKQGFADVAGSDYEVSTYLDVDLTQVWFKGTNAEFGEEGYSENDVWSNEIYDLGDKKATVTITLDEGITPDDIVILHELHDENGTVTGYERVKIINKEQDANGIWTVTFETSKFSNYAIAEKKEDTPENYTVSFNTDGGTEIENQEVASGATATKPEDPTKDGYIFDGWYADDTFAVEFDFESSITRDTTIYAKWNEISNTDTDTEFEYEVVEGENQTIEAEEGEDLTVKANGSIDKFVKLLIDGVEVDPENYTVISGSTIATLSSSFLNTLSSGNHTLTFVYTDGQAQTNFRIASTTNTSTGNTDSEDTTSDSTTSDTTDSGTTKTSNPKTGDNIYKYVTMFAIATVGLMLTKKNKKTMRNKGKH